MGGGHTSKASSEVSDEVSSEAGSLSEDENSYLELLLFAKKSMKNLPVSKELNWFDYGAFYHDYNSSCDGLKLHESSRLFDPSSGKVWIPKKHLMIKICPNGEEETFDSITDGSVVVTEKSRCEYLENPLCSNLVFHISSENLKESRQPPREFLEVLKAKGVDLSPDLEIDTPKKAKGVYLKYFS